jgi:hypothetical protein
MSNSIQRFGSYALWGAPSVKTQMNLSQKTTAIKRPLRFLLFAKQVSFVEKGGASAKKSVFFCLFSIRAEQIGVYIRDTR